MEQVYLVLYGKSQKMTFNVVQKKKNINSKYKRETNEQMKKNKEKQIQTLILCKKDIDTTAKCENKKIKNGIR